MTALNLLAVQNAPLLRMIATATQHQITTNAGLADALDRDASNVSKSVKALIEAGLLNADPLTNGLTLDGAAQLAAIDRAERPISAEPGSSLDGGDSRFPWQVTDILALTHAQILPDPNNARRDWTSDDAREDLDRLREDITANGLLQNLVVRRLAPESDKYVLVGGERRWRAIDLAIQEDDWPAERPIPCRLIEVDEVGQRRAALAENLQRRDLNPLEKAQGFEGLAEALIADGMEAAKVNTHIADLIGKTPEHVQQHRRFLQLDDADQQRLTLAKDDPRHLSVRDARQKLAAKTAPVVPALDVSPVARLTLAETVHCVASTAGYTWGDIKIGHEAFDDPHLAELVDANLMSRPTIREYGGPAILGQIVTTLGYGIKFEAIPGLISGDPAIRDEALRREQALMFETCGMQPEFGSADRPYLTSWLNGPFELTEKGQAVVDERAREEAARDEAEAQREREKAELNAVHAAVAARAREAFERARETVLEAESFNQIAADAETPLPWRVSGTGGIVAANDKPVITSNSKGENFSTARMRLIVLAINAAAGLDTPEEEPDPHAPLAEDAFVSALAKALADEGSEDDVDAVLAEFLTENTVEFGDEGFNWTAAGAVQIATTWAAERVADPAPDAEANQDAD